MGYQETHDSHIPVDLKMMLKNQKDKFKSNAKETLRDSVTYLADAAFDAIPCLAPEVSCFR